MFGAFQDHITVEAQVSYDVSALRAQFPALSAGLAHFEGPGGTQTPLPVIQAIVDALSQPLSNKGYGTPGERNADAIVFEAREAMADFLGSEPGGIVFGRSATSLTYEISRALAKTWGPGDEIVVTDLDHDSNVRPWIQAAEAVGATVRWARFDPATGELTVDHVKAVLSERVRLVAVTAGSNLIGTRPDIKGIADAVHAQGALLYVDAVHFAAHGLPDRQAWNADFVVCSPYKFLGPHIGVLASSIRFLDQLHPDKLLPSSNSVPERFEFGTLPYEMLAGTRAAVDFIAAISPIHEENRRQRLASAFAAIHEHEHRLMGVVEDGLNEMPGVTVHSRAVDRTPTYLVTFADRDPAAAYQFLAERGVVAPAGSFYALEASRSLGLGDTGGLRAGLAPYTDDSDVERLLTGLREFMS
jgi:cysteine desulfurase family protein (TIGR01976 family)